MLYSPSLSFLARTRGTRARGEKLPFKKCKRERRQKSAQWEPPVEYIDAEPDAIAQWLLNEQEAWLFRKHVLQLRANHGPFCRINLGWGDFAESAFQEKV